MTELLNISDFDRIYEIMEESFPDSEFRPYSEQKALWKNESYKVIGVREEGKIIAILALWSFDGFIYFEHLATTPACRNRGIGAQIIKEVRESTSKPLCLEAERPEDEITRRRIAFYERNGMVLNKYDYIQPSISAGRPEVPLYIMTSPSPIDREKYNEIRDTLYEKVYGIKENKAE